MLPIICLIRVYLTGAGSRGRALTHLERATCSPDYIKDLVFSAEYGVHPSAVSSKKLIRASHHFDLLFS